MCSDREAMSKAYSKFRRLSTLAPRTEPAAKYISGGGATERPKTRVLIPTREKSRVDYRLARETTTFGRGPLS